MGKRTEHAFVYLENSEGRLLLVKTKKGEWGLPGGEVEDEEDPRDAAIRELEEETGIDGWIVDFVGVYPAPYRNDTTYVYTAKTKNFTLKEPGDEIVESGFFPKTSLPQPRSASANIRLQDALQRKRGIHRVIIKPGVEG